MRANRVVTIGILVVAGMTAAGVTPARSQNVSDETAPTITNVTLSATSIDTSSGPKSVTVTVTADDDLSGVNYLYVYLRTTATGQPGNQTYLGCFASTLSSGTRLDGTFTGTCTFPQYSQSGSWFVYQTQANDMVGNYKLLYNGGAQLAIAGQTINVTAPSPPPPETGAAPNLVSLSLDPPMVDTSNAPQPFTVTARITSSNGSFSYGYVVLRDPSSTQQVTVYLYSSSRISGDALDGTYQGTTVLPRYSRPGAWTWSYAQFINSSNHSNYYNNAANGVFNYRQTYNGSTWTSAYLGATGPTLTPASLTVQSEPADTNAPTLVNFEINPSSIDVSTSSQTVTITIAVADDLSGVSWGCFSFTSPNRQQVRSGCFNSASTVPISFPQFSQAGNWFLNSLSVADRLGNYRYFSASDISQLGFPTSIQISSGVTVQNATGYVDGTVSLAAKLTKLGLPMAGKSLVFSLRGASVGSAVTDHNGIATIPDVSLVGIPVGTYVNAISASFAGDAEQAAASGQATLVVTNKLTQTISFAPLSDRQLTSSPFTVTATASSVLEVTFAATGVCSVSGSSVILTGAGTCTIIASQAGNGLFNAAPSVSRTFNVASKSDQTITFEAISDRRYGDASFTIEARSSSGLPVALHATGNCSMTGSSVTVGAAGTCQIAASQAGNDAYNAAANVVRTFAIARAPLTVTTDANPTTSSIDRHVKTYNGLVYTGFTVRYEGFVNGETASVLTGTISFTGPGTTATKAGGPYSVTPGGLMSSNYAIMFADGALEISPAPLSIIADANAATLSVERFTKTYNAQVYSGFSVRYAGFVNNEAPSVLNGTLNFTGPAVTATAAGGPYTVTPYGLTSTDYTVSFVSGTLEIAPALLMIAASDAHMVLNGATPPLGAIFSGFVAGENSSNLGGTLNCVTAAATSSAVGSYPITCSGATSSNYSISYKAATLYVQYAAAGSACYGDVGRTMLQPIDADGTSVFKQGSTVPAKFRVCDANGVSIGIEGVVASFALVQVLDGTVGDVDEPIASTTPDASFRWDPPTQQWLFNISTKPLSANRTYIYAITLNDGTSITFRYGLR